MTKPVVAAMAASAEHAATLRLSVESLLPQCDQLRVYWGADKDPPAVLDHPRISVRRASDWDERGSAASFAWMSAGDPPGLRLMTSAGVIYPSDFATTLSDCLARNGGRAIVGVEGALLRQTIGAGSAPRAMPVGSDRERVVHWLGADALLFDSAQVEMDSERFVGDPAYALALYAQRHALPMIAVRHSADWLRRAERWRFAVVWPNDAGVATVRPFQRKTGVVMIVAHCVEAFRNALSAWDRALPGFELALIVVAAAADPALRDAVATCVARHELHVLPEPGAAGEGLAAALLRAARLEPGFFLVTSDSALPVSNDWAAAAAPLCAAAGAAFVCTADAKGTGLRLGTTRRANALGLLCGGDVLARWRDATDGRPTNSDFQQLLDHAAPKGLEMDRVATFEQQFTLARIEPLPLAPVVAAPPADRSPALRINQVFRRRLVINLDRRADRWARMSSELRRAGVDATRFSAVDASTAAVAAQYARYQASGPVEVSESVRKIEDTFAFFNDYDSQRARVAYLERTQREKAIRSAGAWAYLRSWRQILEAAISDGVDTLLVFDDDVAFHADAEALFAAAITSAPDDWLVLQLGTLQYHWSRDWIAPYKSVLWRTHGVAIGSHAVGLRAEAFPYLLAQAARMDMPFDIGALSATVRAFRDRCFVTRPNIAIQRLGGQSDIGSSPFQKGRSEAEIAATYRWRLGDYPGLRSI